MNVWKVDKCKVVGVFVVCNHRPCPHGSVCKNAARGVIRYIVRTQPAGDAAEETVRSIMKVHRCHRLHTEKEERVMLLLVSAYLVLVSNACQEMS